MTNAETKIKITQAQLAKIGEGIVAYVREMPSEELKGKFPSLPEIKPQTRLWALFSANGQPIMFSDARDHALAGALENELTTVALH